MVAGEQVWLPPIHVEVMRLVLKQIRIPESLERRLMEYSEFTGIRIDSIMVFALIRFVEVMAFIFDGGDSDV